MMVDLAFGLNYSFNFLRSEQEESDGATKQPPEEEQEED